MIKIYIDGASIGNPGKTGIGYLIYKNNKLLKKESISLGVQTNNFAEYMALIFSLADLLSMGEKKCQVFSDSNLLCEQIKGNFKTKNQNIYPLYVLAKNLIAKLDEFSLSHIPREKNKEADQLAKKATGFLTM
ncbi:MAG: ribonuclease HI family protein [Candidatus Omnitrophota bacterium]|nr:MAG: ribonuclease HI family protein [Candidatus Omnitrophota bacterium]